jgi:phosphoenolpyruvate-protein kinase (PTS system EI component)
MSTSFQFTSTGTGQSVISVAKSATESGKPQEFVAIDSESVEVRLDPDGQIFKADEAKHEEVREQEATTQQEVEQRRATKSNVWHLSWFDGMSQMQEGSNDSYLV